ncbi:MAG: hypothetical protein J0I12_28760 [Candidatus Eremiobacteraeota bacterium]|nr:hypothetical protein [Candidatus Eremiobacteraeota bacterium]
MMRWWGVGLLAALLVGCGSEEGMTGSGASAAPAQATTTVDPVLDLGLDGAPAPGAAAPGKAQGLFSFQLQGAGDPGPFASAYNTGIETIGLNTPARPARFVVTLLDNAPPGLLDRRLVIQLGVPNGPVLLTNAAYALNGTSARVNYVERSSATQARIFEGANGTITLTELEPGHVDVRLEGIRLIQRGNPSQTLDVQGSGSFDF